MTTHRKFVLVHAPYSGEAFVCKLLNAHREVCCLPNLLGPRSTGLADRSYVADDLLRKYRDADKGLFISRALVSASFSKNWPKAVGFSVQYSRSDKWNLFYENTSLVQFIKDNDFVVIHLKRRNMAARLASAALAATVDRHGCDKVFLSKHECFTDFNFYKDVEVDIHGVFGRSNIFYEFFLEDIAQRIHDVFHLFGLDASGVDGSFALEPPPVDESLKSLVNYKDLAEAFEETEFETFFRT